MAARALFLAILLATSCALVAAATEADLRNAITDPNILTFFLDSDIILTDDLPPVPDNKLFALVGKKGGKKGAKVLIDCEGYALFQNAGTGPVTLHLENLIITDAKEGTAAVTLTVLGTKLTATNVDFKDSSRGLDLTSVDATLKKCTFSGHTNGAIYLQAEEGDPDKVVVDSCTFKNNVADSGAGIFCAKYTTLEVTKSKFISNTAHYRGGAIRLLESSTATIKSSEFTGNIAQDQAGAIAVYNGGIVISGSKFTGNKAIDGPGGALRVSSDDVGAVATVTSSVFTSNSGINGGAFVIEATAGDSQISFCKTTFKTNTPKTGFAIGSNNAIFTKGATPIKDVVVDTGAILAYKRNLSCK